MELGDHINAYFYRLNNIQAWILLERKRTIWRKLDRQLEALSPS